MYLDNAATSFPKPDCVCDAVDAWMRGGAAASGRGSHRGTDAAAKMLEHCRVQLARILDVASPSNVIFTLNCTDSLNTVFQGFLKRGDRVLASTLDHNSVLRPLEAMKEDREVSYSLVDFDPTTGLIDVERFSEILSSWDFKLVVLTHASNVTGRVQQIRALTEIAHQAGAAVLLDAAQTAGHVPLSMLDLNVDFLAAAGHKGLLGPLGTGVLCLRNGIEDRLTPLRFGGTGTASESLAQPTSMPDRFESGNLNLPGIAGLSAAADWILHQTVATLHSTRERLTHRLSEGLKRIPNLRLLSVPASCNAGIICFTVDGHDSRDIAMILDQSFDIQTRAGLHCAPLAHQTLGTFEMGGAVRLSPGIETSESDIDAAISAIDAIASQL